MEAAQTRRLRYDCRCAYTLKSDLEPRAAEITTSFGKSEPMIKSGRIIDICIALLLCASIFSSGFAQESGDVQALIQKLEDQDKQARIIAIKKVKILGVEAKAAIPALTLLLKDSDTDLRENAAEALGKMGVEARAASPRDRSPQGQQRSGQKQRRLCPGPDRRRSQVGSAGGWANY